MKHRQYLSVRLIEPSCNLYDVSGCFSNPFHFPTFTVIVVGSQTLLQVDDIGHQEREVRIKRLIRGSFIGKSCLEPASNRRSIQKILHGPMKIRDFLRGPQSLSPIILYHRAPFMSGIKRSRFLGLFAGSRFPVSVKNIMCL